MAGYVSTVVAGEKDAGKSTLIGRLLCDSGTVPGGAADYACIPDALEEERKGSYTLDAAYACCRLEKGKEFVFIDVPGHEALLKNMLSGSSSAESAVLVTDVRNPLNEQARRHVMVLKFLGIDNVIVAVNKMDLVNYNRGVYEKTKKALEEYFRKIRIHPRGILPVSAKEGENLIVKSGKMKWNKTGTLAKSLAHIRRKRINGDFRLPVQDIYDIDGEKTAVGNIISGSVRKGAKVKILPAGADLRIKDIRVFPGKISSAVAPMSIGVVLDDMGPVSRGQVLCAPELPAVKKVIPAGIFCISPVRLSERFTLKCSVQKIAARLTGITAVWSASEEDSAGGADTVPAGYFARAVVETENPVVVDRFQGFSSLGRFVLEKDENICAAGVI